MKPGTVHIEIVRRARTPGNPAKEQTMPGRGEHQFLTDTMILRNSLVRHGDAVRDRLRAYGYKWAWRDIRLLTSLVTRIQDQLLGTVPPKRQAYYDRLATSGVYRVEMAGPVDRRYVWADAEDLAALTEAAMLTECAMCVREGRELRECRLRQALVALAPLDPADVNDRFATCEYRGTASSLISGEETHL